MTRLLLLFSLVLSCLLLLRRLAKARHGGRNEVNKAKEICDLAKVKLGKVCSRECRFCQVDKRVPKSTEIRLESQLVSEIFNESTCRHRPVYLYEGRET